MNFRIVLLTLLLGSNFIAWAADQFHCPPPKDLRSINLTHVLVDPTPPRQYLATNSSQEFRPTLSFFNSPLRWQIYLAGLVAPTFKQILQQANDLLHKQPLAIWPFQHAPAGMTLKINGRYGCAYQFPKLSAPLKEDIMVVALGTKPSQKIAHTSPIQGGQLQQIKKKVRRMR